MTQGKQRPEKGQVQVRTYGTLDPATNMREWPNAKDIMGIWEAEGVPPPQQQQQQQQDEAFWQASIRWALLKKFNHCPKELQNPYEKKADGLRALQLSQKDIQTISNIWQEQCSLAISSPDVSTNAEDKDLREFLSSGGLSNGRKLQWSFMDCGPSKQFPLHAHPNLEVMYCLRGALHEIRINGAPFTKSFELDTTTESSEHDTNNNALKGPDLSTTTTGHSWKFSTVRQGEFLVNEVGSIHKSFAATNGDGCSMLVLWGGSHADISKEMEPKSFNVQAALEKMDQKLCDCTTMDQIDSVVGELFLPDSERSSQ